MNMLRKSLHKYLCNLDIASSYQRVGHRGFSKEESDLDDDGWGYFDDIDRDDSLQKSISLMSDCDVLDNRLVVRWSLLPVEREYALMKAESRSKLNVELPSIQRIFLHYHQKDKPLMAKVKAGKSMQRIIAPIDKLSYRTIAVFGTYNKPCPIHCIVRKGS
jgi:hypothetical protein